MDPVHRTAPWDAVDRAFQLSMLHTYAAYHVRITELGALAFLRRWLGDDGTEVVAQGETRRVRLLIDSQDCRTNDRSQACASE